MRLGIRCDEVEPYPQLRWERESCALCGARVWVPARLEGETRCVQHGIGARSAPGSLEDDIRIRAEFLDSLVRKTGNTDPEARVE